MSVHKLSNSWEHSRIDMVICSDMADQYPSAEVVGIDLSPVQPKFVPPNCQFQIDDASVEWTFPPGSRDFVFFRFMLGCFPDWPAVYRQAFK